MSSSVGLTIRHDANGAVRGPARLWVYPYVAAWAALAIGAMGLMGWLLDVPILRGLFSEGLTIKANSAVALVLISSALLLVQPKVCTLPRTRVAQALAIVTILLGGLTLVEIITGIDLGIDELLLRGTGAAVDARSPNRMGPPAAVAYFAAGVAVLLLNYTMASGLCPSDVFAVIVLVCGMVPFVGYLYGAHELYKVAGFTGTALQTSLAVTMVGIAIFLSRPNQGLISIITDGGTAGTIVRRLILPIVLFPLLVGWVQIQVLKANAFEYQFVAVMGSLLVVSVLVSLLIGFGRRLSVAEQERAAADRDVRDAQDRLSMALAAARAGALDWDLLTDRITWSRESYLLYGLGPRGLPANYADWLALVHPDDRPIIADTVPRAVNSNRDVDMQFRIVGEDSETRWFRTVGRVLRDLDGKPNRFTGITSDITAEKLNEIQLRRTAQRLEMLYNTTIAVLSTDDAQSAARAVCERVLGQLDCQVMLNYVITDTKPDHIQLYSWAGIDEEQARTWSLMHVDKIISGTVVRDGTRLVLEDVPSTSPDPRTNVIRDLGMLAYACHPLVSNGHVIGTIGFGSRTTRRFSLETLALMQAVANHIALALQRARASQELAQTRNWQERFIMVLSHDLRMPLTPMMVAAGMLEHDPEEHGPAFHEQISMIRRNAELEARLIDDLLDVARINQGKLQLKREAVSVHEAIRQAVEACWSELRDRQLILATDLLASHDTVTGDAQRLEQAIWNIIRYSAGLTPARGTIRIQTENAEPGRVRVTVRDTGAGLTAEEIGRVFDPLAAVPAGGVDYTASGLASLVAKGLIELQGGTISVSSAGQGQGTSFGMSLPLVTRDVAPSKTEPVRRQVRSSRVLVVEDHADTSRALARLLTHMGNEVHCAATVADAIELARIHALDLLIADISLPDGTGIDLLHRVQGIQPVRAIAISGYALDQDLKRSLQAGFSAHLNKPVSIEQLTSAMSEAIGEPVPAERAHSL